MSNEICCYTVHNDGNLKRQHAFSDIRGVNKIAEEELSANTGQAKEKVEEPDEEGKAGKQDKRTPARAGEMK